MGFRDFRIKMKSRFGFLNKMRYGFFGRKSVIYKPLYVGEKKRIFVGSGVFVAEFARIETIDSWGEQRFDPRVEIGDGTTFEQSAHIVSAGLVKIGKGCTFSSRVMINGTEHDYSAPDRKVTDNPLLFGDITIGDFCFIGMDVKIFPGANIGRNVIVGANSVVMNDLPDYTVCVGCPARPIKKYNTETGLWERTDGKTL